MIPRDAVIELLRGDPELLGQWGIGPDTVFPDNTVDFATDIGGTIKNGRFLILQWGESPLRGHRDVHVLTVWAHRSRQQGADFLELTRIIERVRQVLTSATHVAGADGVVLSQARYTGMGGDLPDTGYDTFTRNAAFEVLGYSQQLVG